MLDFLVIYLSVVALIGWIFSMICLRHWHYALINWRKAIDGWDNAVKMWEKWLKEYEKLQNAS